MPRAASHSTRPGSPMRWANACITNQRNAASRGASRRSSTPCARHAQRPAAKATTPDASRARQPATDGLAARRHQPAQRRGERHDLSARAAVHRQRTDGRPEGVAEAAGSLLKLIAGVLADRMRRIKPFVVIGYGLAGIARPLIGIATSWMGVLVFRFVDRVGKGLR